MTSEEMLDLVQTMTEETDDVILETYIEQAGDIVLQQAYPYEDVSTLVVPDKYHRVQVDIAVYLINKRGAEGQLTHTENGISRSYEAGDVPSTLLRRIIPSASLPIRPVVSGGEDTP